MFYSDAYIFYNWTEPFQSDSEYIHTLFMYMYYEGIQIVKIQIRVLSHVNMGMMRTVLE